MNTRIAVINKTFVKPSLKQTLKGFTTLVASEKGKRVSTDSRDGLYPRKNSPK
jgi:hypothetical protein